MRLGLWLAAVAADHVCLLQTRLRSKAGDRTLDANHPPVPVKVDDDGLMHPLPLDYEEKRHEHVLVPFVEVDELCEYATYEMPRCVNYEPTVSYDHMVTRRYAMLFMIFAIAIWSMTNELVVNSITAYTAKNGGEQALEVLHALFSEVTVLGFIALLSGIFIRSGRLHSLSEWLFGDGPKHPHAEHEVFGNATVWKNIAQIMPGQFAIVEGQLDLRDGRELSELTVLFEDIHIILFLIMLALIAVAAVNLHQVNQITNEWVYADKLVEKHGELSAFQILSTLTQSPMTGWFRGRKLQRHLTYLSYRHEFLWPAFGNSPEGVDPDTFPFGEYLQYCAGMAVVETVEVPIWMYVFNSFFVVLLRPFFSITAVCWSLSEAHMGVLRGARPCECSGPFLGSFCVHVLGIGRLSDVLLFLEFGFFFKRGCACYCFRYLSNPPGCPEHPGIRSGGTEPFSSQW